MGRRERGARGDNGRCGRQAAAQSPSAISQLPMREAPHLHPRHRPRSRTHVLLHQGAGAPLGEGRQGPAKGLPQQLPGQGHIDDDLHRIREGKRQAGLSGGSGRASGVQAPSVPGQAAAAPTEDASPHPAPSQPASGGGGGCQAAAAAAPGTPGGAHLLLHGLGHLLHLLQVLGTRKAQPARKVDEAHGGDLRAGGRAARGGWVGGRASRSRTCAAVEPRAAQLLIELPGRAPAAGPAGVQPPQPPRCFDAPARRRRGRSAAQGRGLR